ncbi:MAG: Ig-like domain-containing protein [Oscillospiraceae bacterium]|nr:Ig-like domain-containing protein [Oscillospiraceae bacterium]
MKTSVKRVLSLALAFMLVLSFASVAYAHPALDDEDWNWDYDYGSNEGSSSGNDEGSSGSGSGGRGYIDVTATGDTYLDVGESGYASATTTGDDATSYSWSSSDSSVVSVSGSSAQATLSARSAGSATITVTVSSAYGDIAFDFFTVQVNSAKKPVVVTGGTSLTMKVGDTRNLTGSVSGGSGSYEYVWDFDGNIYSNDSMRQNATIEALSGGSGSATLTVYDADDRSNYDSTTWSVTIEKSAETPPSVRIDKNRLSLKTGETASLTMSASGGSGSYEYYWESDDHTVAEVIGNGSTVSIVAVNDLLRNPDSCTISGIVKDSNGNWSDPVECTVTVTSAGGSGSYNASGSASVGSALNMDGIGNSIASAFRSQLGKTLDYGATLYINSPSSNTGYLTLQDGSKLNGGTAYTYAHFGMMVFQPSRSGSFSTGYTLNDGGYTMSGTISISVSGGSSISSVSLSPGSLTLDTYSEQYVYLNVSPSNASYDVRWSSNNTNVASIYGSGSNVTVRSGGRTGSATITATVTDSNGSTRTATCSVNVNNSGHGTYNPTLTVTLGSDYYGTSTSNNMSNQFHSFFGTYLPDNATIRFSSTGNSRYGVQRLANGRAISANTNYTFRDWIDAYFEPIAAGTFSLPYTITYNGNTMSGTFDIYIRGSSVNASINPTSMRLSTYGSQDVSISMSGSYRRISWYTSNSNIATVSGSGTRVTVNAKGTNGSCTISADIEDANGVTVTKNCTVTVSSSGGSYNPSVTTTLGVPYTGTGTSDAMKNQFRSVYNTTLNENSATIRFSSVGNNNIAVLRLSDGSAARANTNYTFAQYRAMYTAPVSSGTFSFPYTLTYNNKSLSGTVSVNINSSSINAAVNLASSAPYLFSTASMNGSTGASLLSGSIQNAVGSSWSYLRFSKWSDNTGTLYLNSSMTALNANTNVNSSALNNLYFVPGAMSGAFSAQFTAYNSGGSALGSGTLTITKAVTTFSDVPASAYYFDAVNWAVRNSITAGTNTTLNTFSPANTVTRAEAVTFLWRVMGQPEPRSLTNPFIDVGTADYFLKPVLWAVENGITLGTNAAGTTFSPNNPVTKIQMLSFIYRCRGGYVNLATWETDTVNWANGQSMLAGIPTIFVSSDSCPRSDVVYYLYRDSLMH